MNSSLNFYKIYLYKREQTPVCLSVYLSIYLSIFLYVLTPKRTSDGCPGNQVLGVCLLFTLVCYCALLVESKRRASVYLIMLSAKQDSHWYHFYAPNFEKVGSILVSACAFVRSSGQNRIQARVLKFHIWIPHQKIAYPYFFSCLNYLPLPSYAPFKG